MEQTARALEAAKQWEARATQAGTDLHQWAQRAVAAKNEANATWVTANRAWREKLACPTDRSLHDHAQILLAAVERVKALEVQLGDAVRQRESAQQHLDEERADLSRQIETAQDASRLAEARARILADGIEAVLGVTATQAAERAYHASRPPAYDPNAAGRALVEGLRGWAREAAFAASMREVLEREVMRLHRVIRDAGERPGPDADLPQPAAGPDPQQQLAEAMADAHAAG